MLSRLAGVLVGEGLRNRSAVLATRVKGVVSGGILVVGLLLALKQMGIQTDVVVLILAALLAAGAIAAGLASGLGWHFSSPARSPPAVMSRTASPPAS